MIIIDLLQPMNVISKKSKHSAPGQYLGFALQPVRLCYYLLKGKPGDTASLEHSDDVTLHQRDGISVLEQTKSALSGNPISDWAIDLWKTIANWLDEIAGGNIDPAKSLFRLYVTPPYAADFAMALGAAKTEQEVELLVAKISKALESKEKKPECWKYLKKFMEASESERFALVSRITIESHHDDPVAPIRELLSPTIEPKSMDSICHWAIGTAKQEADKLIREKKPAILSCEVFQAAFRNFVQKNNLPNFLTSFAEIPPEHRVSEVLSARPIFVRQLELVKAEEDLRLRAVSDFLRTSADKSIWAESGKIFEDELKTWDNDLIRRYDFIRNEQATTQSKLDQVERGRLVYLRCAQLDVALAARAVPGHFVNGSYNNLADNLRLGWHEKFEELLNKSDRDAA